MPKRRRTRATYNIKKVRPKDKQIIGLSIGNGFATVNTFNQVLYTATFPATVTGVRWELSYGNTGHPFQNINWAIVILRQGVNIGALSAAQNVTLYSPEQNVIAWGIVSFTGGIDDDAAAVSGKPVGEDMGSTKSMRKLMAGDRLVFVNSLATNGDAAIRLQGAIQFFLLS